MSIKFIHDDAMGLQQNCAQNLSKIIEVSPRIIGSWKLVVRGRAFCCVQHQQLRDAIWNFGCHREQRSLAQYPRKRFIRAGERSGYVQVTLFEQYSTMRPLSLSQIEICTTGERAWPVPLPSWNTSRWLATFLPLRARWC